jgi:hypothetical protein
MFCAKKVTKLPDLTVRSFAVTPTVQSNNFKIQNPPVVGWRQVLCMTPSPRQSPKENKFKLWPKIYVLKCSLYTSMNAHLGSEKKLSQMVQNYSELYLTVPPPHCRLPLRERCSGDSDLYLCNLPVDLRS